MMLMKPTTVVGLMTFLSVLAVFFAGRTNAQRFRGGTHGEELRTARRMEIITPPSEALVEVNAHELDYDELALLRGGQQRALTEKSKSKKSKSKSKKSKSKTEKSKKSKSDKGTKSTKKSKSEKKSDKGTKSSKKSKSEKGTKSTKKSKSNKSKSSKSKSRKSMTGTQRAAVLDRLQILNGGGASTSISNTNPQLQVSGLAGRSTGLGLMNLLDNNDEMDVFGQKLPRANTNDNAAEVETTLSKLAQLAAAAF